MVVRIFGTRTASCQAMIVCSHLGSLPIKLTLTSKLKITLQCFIISDTYQPPISVTRCGHSFCEKCLLEMSTACPDSRDWSCPTCKEVHTCSVNDLTRNFFAEQIVESFQAQPSAEFGVCEDHQQEITLRKTKKLFLLSINDLFYISTKNIRLGCLTHFEDLCFICGFYKFCNGVKRNDCETVEKIDFKRMVQKETKSIQEKVQIIYI